MTEKLKMEQNPLSATVEKIKEICPGAVTREGKIDFEELKTALRDDVASDIIEKYEFTWVGKNTAKAEANRPIRKTLRPVIEDSKNWDTTQNLYIEGDNLDTLKLLQESYLGKVKMIYIDPPYNTGNDFVYCDEFSVGCEEYLDKKGQCDADGNRLFVNTETNGRFHSDWCSMMYPRLKIARDLLCDDGIIFISIDDHEQGNLKKICDEIFGENNFLSNITVETGGGVYGAKASQVGRTFVKTKEYLLVYTKNKSIRTDFLPIYMPAEKLFDTHYNKYISDKLEIVPLAQYLKSVGWVVEEFKKYEIPISVATIDTLMHISMKFREYIYNELSNNIYGDWAYTGNVEFTDNDVHLVDGLLVFKTTGGKYRFYRSLSEAVRLTDDYSPSKCLSFAAGDLWNGFYQDMTNISDEGEVEFRNGKKPVRLVKRILKWYNNHDSLVLDFFSGSATTAHAVMQLNAEDGGHRKFIMVQLPEKCEEDSEAFKAGYKNICEIGKERIRRAGEKIKSENPDKDLDIGFRVLRVDSSNMKDVFYKPSDTTQKTLLDSIDNIKEDRSDMDLLFGVMVDCGLPLDMPIETRKCEGKKYYVVNGEDYLVACFEPEISEKLVYEIANLKPTIAVFRDSSFADAKDKVNVSEIFKNITGHDDCVKVL